MLISLEELCFLHVNLRAMVLNLGESVSLLHARTSRTLATDGVRATVVSMLPQAIVECISVVSLHRRSI